MDLDVFTKAVMDYLFDHSLNSKISWEGTKECFSKKWTEEEKEEKFRSSFQELDVGKRIRGLIYNGGRIGCVGGRWRHDSDTKQIDMAISAWLKRRERQKLATDVRNDRYRRHPDTIGNKKKKLTCDANTASNVSSVNRERRTTVRRAQAALLGTHHHLSVERAVFRMIPIMVVLAVWARCRSKVDQAVIHQSAETRIFWHGQYCRVYLPLIRRLFRVTRRHIQLLHRNTVLVQVPSVLRECDLIQPTLHMLHRNMVLVQVPSAFRECHLNQSTIHLLHRDTVLVQFPSAECQFAQHT